VGRRPGRYTSPRRAAATKRPGTFSFLPSGVVTSTRPGAVAFHCARRDLVRLRDFLRVGTAIRCLAFRSGGGTSPLAADREAPLDGRHRLHVRHQEEPPQRPDRMVLRKFDPVAREHVEFREER
jgi:hypothetical protein